MPSEGVDKTPGVLYLSILNPNTMRTRISFRILAAGVLLLAFSCREKEPQPEPYYLTVKMSGVSQPHGTYYLVPWTERSLLLDFSENLDTATLAGAVTVSDQGPLNASQYSVSCYGSKVFIIFSNGFMLKEGWKYTVNVSAALKSASGTSLKAADALEIRTTTGHPGLTGTARNSIICISDIHMGDLRASALRYAWFGENAEALDSLLQMIIRSPRVRQLVILGDLFDGWVIPYPINPLDPQAGINSAEDYFRAIAASPVNSGVISSLKAIAAGGVTELIYIPGNHDMLLTQELLQEHIPGITWLGDARGLTRQQALGHATQTRVLHAFNLGVGACAKFAGDNLPESGFELGWREPGEQKGEAEQERATKAQNLQKAAVAMRIKNRLGRRHGGLAGWRNWKELRSEASCSDSRSPRPLSIRPRHGPLR